MFFAALSLRTGLPLNGDVRGISQKSRKMADRLVLATPYGYRVAMECFRECPQDVVSSEI